MILVSDTHRLLTAAPEAEANWDAVLRYVGANAPNIIIHLGDLSLDGAHNAGDLHYGRGSSTGCPCPGTRFPAITTSATTHGPARQRTLPSMPAGASVGWNIVGADHWSLTVNGWTLLAINAQLPGSGLEAEAGQWSWLEEQLSGLSENQRIVLITHKPVTATDAELATRRPTGFCCSRLVTVFAACTGKRR